MHSVAWYPHQVKPVKMLVSMDEHRIRLGFSVPDFLRSRNVYLSLLCCIQSMRVWMSHTAEIAVLLQMACYMELENSRNWCPLNVLQMLGQFDEKKSSMQGNVAIKTLQLNVLCVYIYLKLKPSYNTQLGESLHDHAYEHITLI